MTTEAREFGHLIKGMGFRVFIAKDGHYGFITKADGSRVVNFSFRDGSLGGNYMPPSRESGTGWRMDGRSLGDLKTADDVRKALDANPPSWCGKGWQRMATLDDILAMYGKSSGYQEL